MLSLDRYVSHLILAGNVSLDMHTLRFPTFPGMYGGFPGSMKVSRDVLSYGGFPGCMVVSREV